MNKQPGANFLNELLGGAQGDWRHRILHFHISLALVNAGVILLWMSFPLFQTSRHQGTPQTHEGTSGQHSQPEPDGGTSPVIHSGNQTANIERNDRLFVARFTTATGYVALGLLALTLLIGPANLMLSRRNPVSSYLTRDVGMWGRS